MSWYISTLDSSQVAAGEALRSKEVFSEAFTTAKAPRTMALFQMKREGGSLDLYLTPVCVDHAAELIESWQAVPCERPSPRNLEFLVGLNEITYYLP